MADKVRENNPKHNYPEHVSKKGIDWVAIRKEYVTNPTTTYRKLADQFGVSRRAVEIHASDEGWQQARKRAFDNAGELVVEKAAAELSEVNRRHTTTYRNMQALASAQLNIAFRQMQRMEEEARAKGKDVNIYQKGMISQHRMKSMFEALKIAMDGERITLGLPITVQKTEVVGGDGGPLFETVDLDELQRLIGDTVSALTEE